MHAQNVNKKTRVQSGDFFSKISNKIWHFDGLGRKNMVQFCKFLITYLHPTHC